MKKSSAFKLIANKSPKSNTKQFTEFVEHQCKTENVREDTLKEVVTHILKGNESLAEDIMNLRNNDSGYLFENREALFSLYFIFEHLGEDAVRKIANGSIKDIIFDSPLLDDIKAEQQYKRDLLLDKHIPIKKQNACSNCRSELFYERTIQTRRADEGMTTILSCAQCGKISRKS